MANLESSTQGCCSVPMKRVKLAFRLWVFFIVVGVLVSGVVVVTTNISASDLGLGDEPIKLVSNDSPTYPFRDHYLHNNPTPPTGDTTSQADLPLDETAPTATTLYNFDQDIDGAAGRLVGKGGSGASETDLGKYQNWRTGALSPDHIINGVVNLSFSSAIKDFGDLKRGHVQAFLRDYNGTSYTEITNGSLDVSDWQGGSSTWVWNTLAFPSVNYTVVAGNRLEVKIILGLNAGDDMWLSYDTTAYNSHLQFP